MGWREAPRLCGNWLAAKPGTKSTSLIPDTRTECHWPPIFSSPEMLGWPLTSALTSSVHAPGVGWSMEATNTLGTVFINCRSPSSFVISLPSRTTNATHPLYGWHYNWFVLSLSTPFGQFQLKECVNERENTGSQSADTLATRFKQSVLPEFS